MIVYTSIFGDYDTLKEPKVVNDKIEYVCFTDQDFTSDIWEIRKKPCKLTPRRESRRYKILSHRYFGNRVTLYIDGSLLLTKDPYRYCKRHLKQGKFFVTKHWRNCIYSEAKAVKYKTNHEKLKTQIQTYKKNGYPKNNGLTDNTSLLRRRTKKMVRFEKLWWNEYINGCRRDQISFPYAAWKVDLKYKLFDWRHFSQKKGHIK